MAKSPTEQIRELERIVYTQQQELVQLRRELEELKARLREGERTATNTAQDLSAQKIKSDEHARRTDDLAKRVDESDRRFWNLVTTLVVAGLSPASGLIVALTKK